MKKILFTALITTLVGSLSFAQTNRKETKNNSKSFIGVTGGYTHAMGNFIKNNYYDNTSGYSNSAGYNLGFEGAYYIHKNSGIGGLISNTSFYAKGLQTLADGYKTDFDVDSTTVLVSGKYSTYNFLVGPYFSFPIKKFTFDCRILGGLVAAKTPEFKVALEDQTDVTFYQKSAKANTFGIQTGAGIRYSIIENMCIKLNADFFYSKPNFKITNENRVVSAGRLITEYKQPIMGVCLNFGIAYQFSN